MADSSFQAVRRHLYRQSLTIVVAAMLVVLLASAVVLVVLQVLDHERANLEADFTATVAYIHEQEQFLRKLQVQNSKLSLGNTPAAAAGQRSAVLITLQEMVPSTERRLHYAALSAHFSDYYALFWSFSDFPAAQLLVVDENDTVRWIVPGLDTDEAVFHHHPLDALMLEQAIDAAHYYFSAETANRDTDRPVWLALADQPQYMLAVLPAAFPESATPALHSNRSSLPSLWLLMVMNHQRLQAPTQTSVLERHTFWLRDGQGRQLLGDGAMPSLTNGLNLTWRGVTQCFSSSTSDWRGCYRIGYIDFMGAHPWPIILIMPLLVLSGWGGLRWLRWFRQHVIEPAQRTHHALAQAKADALAASAAKSAFVATMSHEIRTPLHALLGSVELLGLTRLCSQQRRYVQRIQDASQMLMQQISDNLDISRIEAGQMQLHLAPFDPHLLLDNTVAIHQDRARQKNLSLHCHIDTAISKPLLGDAARIQQLLNNLIGNAIKFTDQGQVEIRLEQRSVTHARCQLHLQVKDSGCGITAEHRALLFTPFYLPNNTATTSAQGAGLGLALCQHLATLMGSQLEVDSIPGKGSCFSLDLDLPIATDLPVMALTKPAAAIKSLSPLPHLNILIAEDNPFNRATLQDQLQQLGCTVKLAVDGQQALNDWFTETFDVLLTDSCMPQLNGYELVKRLRQRGVKQPLIGISADTQADDRQRGLDSGMNAWLNKPVSLQQLHHVLTTFCPQKSVATPASTTSVKTDDSDKKDIAFKELFLTTLRADIRQLQQALTQKNTEALLKILHRIRGALAVTENHASLLKSLTQVQQQLQQQGFKPALAIQLQSLINEMQQLFEAEINNKN